VIRHSLALRLFARMAPMLVAAAALPWVVAYWYRSWWLAALCIVVELGWVLAILRSALGPWRALFRALAGSVNSYHDGEYNFGIAWQSADELGELVDAHARMGQVLREQRQALAQRELLLDTMVQNTPVSMVLVAVGNDGQRRVMYANLAARKLLGDGRSLEGLAFDALLDALPAQLREAVGRGSDSLFSIASDDDDQVYHLSQRDFRLNGRRHELLLVRQLTAELRRQEVQTWKKVIRVISHELNNSLGPIASLAHSGSELVRRNQTARLQEVFSTIEERARHLERFVGGYAQFAKLPKPQLQRVEWHSFLAGLQRQIAFTIDAPAMAVEASIDPAQMEQALLNLVKNAHEACGGTAPDVTVHIASLPGWLRVDVLDRGPGMSTTVLENALVPFYSTKHHGTGLGLALTREIVEAHGGRVSLHNRKGGGLCVALQLPSRA
jgi:two-component system, NtrC family, nitrogen regulation sensor histidine kinase NtrY